MGISYLYFIHEQGRTFLNAYRSERRFGRPPKRAFKVSIAVTRDLREIDHLLADTKSSRFASISEGGDDA